MKKLLLSLCVLCLLVCGCSQAPEVSSASDVVKTYLNENKNKINESSLDDLGLSDLQTESGISFDEEILKSLAKSIGDYDYEVDSEKEEGDTATVTVTISTYDFGQWITNLITEAISQSASLVLSGDTSDEAINEVMNKVLNEQTEAIIKAGKTKKTTIDIVCKKVDGNWVVDEEATGDELTDALSGGLLDSAENLIS